jgi:Fe-S-cluster containining protein
MKAPVFHGSPGNDQTVLEPGVHYVCQRCNACCKWPGDVRISEGDISAIADFLGLSDNDFIFRYTRLRTNRTGLSLVEKDNHECIMLEDGGCRIHPVKPSQCAGFPNKWNFPGWRDICEAIPVRADSGDSKNISTF